MFTRACSLILLFVIGLKADAVNVTDELALITAQLQTLQTQYVTEITNMKREIEELKLKTTSNQIKNIERNEKVSLEWTKSSIKEIHSEIEEVRRSINSTAILVDLHNMKTQIEQASSERAEIRHRVKVIETSVLKIEKGAKEMAHDNQQLRSYYADLRALVFDMDKDITSMNLPSENDVPEFEFEPPHPHRLRHNKKCHQQIMRLAKRQEHWDENHQELKSQLSIMQRQLDRIHEPNWNLMSAKLELVEAETKILRENLKNTSQKVSDFDMVHASMLELREEVENIENKADKTVPEFRKEISKLDVGLAQMNAQVSYIKEDQENLRQSVKAIAVSVSNVIDRAEVDRLSISRLDQCIDDLELRAKQHFHKLNDHIMKAEVNNDKVNQTITPLSEIMGDVIELQPVEREYEDLVKQLPNDCSTISGPDGLYLIHPDQQPLEIWCTNGSTVLQRRFNGSVEFNRPFSDYTQAFGDPTGEYWIGLNNMHKLTADNCSSMRIDMTDIYGGVWYAQYDHFFIGDADSGYRLNLSGYRGNASDAFAYQNNMEFSAMDHDRDISNTHCARNYEGGWWYSHCQHVNINGKYSLGLTWFDSDKNEWIAVSTSTMRLLRKNNCF